MRVNFTWKTIHEDLLLREVLLLEPFQYRQGTKEKGAVWSKIADKADGSKVSAYRNRKKKVTCMIFSLFIIHYFQKLTVTTPK